MPPGEPSLDVELAGTIAALATASAAVSEPTAASAVQLAIGAVDPDAIRPYWLAVPGDVGRGDAVDPARIGPAVWFQTMDEPRPDATASTSTSTSTSPTTWPRVASPRPSPPAARS